MAQETTRYRQDEAGYGQRSAEQRPAADDPLAELARLMSQEDELAALTRDIQRPSRRPAPPISRTPAAAAPRPAAPAARAPAPGSFAALAADVYSENSPRPASAPAPRAERHSLEDAARDLNRGLSRSEPRASEARAPEPRAQESRAYVPPRPQSTEPRVAPPLVEPASRGLERSHVAESGLDAVSQALGQPAPVEAPAPRVSRAAPAPRPVEARPVNLDEQAYDYGRSATESDDHLNEAQEGFDETYESYEVERPAPRRRRLLVVGGVVALVVIGVAGVFAFRSTGGGGTTTAANQPPVIRADQGPNKVVPAQPAPTEQATDGQKLIYDRVGGTAPTGNERVVSSEEQPVDVSQAAQPRVIAPATGNAPTPVQPTTSSNSTEPKRVRTLTVRADGTIVADAAPVPLPGVAPAALAAGSQPAASAPIALSSGTAAPINTSPTPLSATPSIVDNMPAQPAAPRAPTNVAAAPAPAPAATGGAPAGAYVVQIASVRSEAEAQATWKSWQTKFPNVLSGQPFNVRRADLGDRGVYYRAQVGSFGSREQANALCQALRAQGGDCMVQRN